MFEYTFEVSVHAVGNVTVYAKTYEEAEKLAGSKYAGAVEELEARSIDSVDCLLATDNPVEE